MTDNGVSGLVEFLLARIAEDEAMIPAFERNQPDFFATGWDPDIDAVAAYPQRWLAECEAKRQVLQLAQDARLYAAVIEALALPYADHSDYRQEWRP